MRAPGCTFPWAPRPPPSVWPEPVALPTRLSPAQLADRSQRSGWVAPTSRDTAAGVGGLSGNQTELGEALVTLP